MAYINITFSLSDGKQTLQISGYDSIEIVGDLLRADERDLARRVSDGWVVDSIFGLSRWDNIKFEPRNSE